MSRVRLVMMIGLTWVSLGSGLALPAGMEGTSGGVSEADLRLELDLQRHSIRIGDHMIVSLRIVGPGLKTVLGETQHLPLDGMSDEAFVYRFTVRPSAEGSYTLGPYSLSFNGQSLRSNTVSLTVLPEWDGRHGTFFRVDRDRIELGEWFELMAETWSTEMIPLRLNLRRDRRFDMGVVNTNTSRHSKDDGATAYTTTCWRIKPFTPGDFQIDAALFRDFPEDIKPPALVVHVQEPNTSSTPPPNASATKTLADEPLERFAKVANRLVQAIDAGDYTAIDRQFNQGMREALPPAEAEAFFRNLATNFGKIENLGAGRFVPPSQMVFPVRFTEAVLDMTITLDNEDKIAGLLFLPHVENIPAPEKNTVTLRLPFEGQWYVFWGGDTRDLNKHHDTPNQKYAFDFLAADETGKAHTGEGTANEDYYAFGRKILAPADGVVTDVIQGVRDNRPGSMNPYSGLGNAVFIQHAGHEISVLAHFQQGSITVKVGDRVEAGQMLGRCGNSGNSSEPHLHYHLQNTAVMQDATGIKCVFEGLTVTRDGKERLGTRYSPIKGDRIEGKK